MLVSGIAIWKPVQTYPLELLFGGFQGARLVHFLVMAGMVFFLVVHVALTLLVPLTLLAMVVGRATELRHMSHRRTHDDVRQTPGAAGWAVARCLDIAHRLRSERPRRGAARSGALLAVERPGAGRNVRPSRLAPTFPEAEAVKDFRYNAWYGPDKAPRLNPADYRLRCRVGSTTSSRGRSITLCAAQTSQITRHVCVEGWSMIGKWSGTPLRTFLERIGADTTARYVGFECADGYYEGIDMPTALHPQTLMAFRLSDEILPTKYGYPFKIRIPTKLGFKNPKFVTAIYVTDKQPRGYWTDRGYNWFSGI